jgi:DNA-binding NtrC family response regulator
MALKRPRPVRTRLIKRGQCRVLLALGQRALCSAMYLRLRAAGCSPTLVEDASGVLALLGEAEQGAGVVVVADGHPGLDLLAETRVRGWSLPVIVVLERNAGLDAVQRAWQLGAYAVFHSPVDLDAIEMAVVCAGDQRSRWA